MDIARAGKPGKPDNIRSMSVHRGLCIFYVLMGLVLVLIFDDEPQDVSFVVPAVVLAMIGVIHGAIAFGAARSASWARASSMAVGCLMLLGFPIGTFIGVYLLVNLKWPDRDAP